MSQTPLNLTPIDMNKTNAKTSHFDSTPVGTKIPDPKPLTPPTESSKCKGRDHVPEYQESDSSSSDSSLSESYFSNDRKCRKSRSKNKYDSSNDSKYRKSKINKRDKKKKTPETHETGLVILIVDRL